MQDSYNLTQLLLSQRIWRTAMAASTVVLSSPPSGSPGALTPANFRHTAMSSSPNLPSPSQLFCSVPSEVASGGQATTASTDAVVGFARASNLLRAARLDGEIHSQSTARRLGLSDRSNTHDKVQHNPKDAKPKKGKENREVPLFKKPKALLKEQSIPGKTLGECAVIFPLKGDKKAIEKSAPKRSRRSNGKKESGEQTRIKDTKITKACSSRTDQEKKKKKKETTERPIANGSETFNTLLPSPEEDAKAREEFRGLCLDKAIPLSRQWTPCKDTVQEPLRENSMQSPSSPVNSGTYEDNALPVARFGQLLGDFGLPKQEAASLSKIDVPREDTGEAVMKKRRIEIVQGISAVPSVEKPKRIKSPKKKPQTITEKATAPFVLSSRETAPSLLQYFDPPDVSSEALVKNQTVDDCASKERPRKSATKKTPARKTVVKTQRPVLHSPETAIKSAENQGMIFGTSSQLAREDSPTFVHNPDKALEDSISMSQELGESILPAGRFRTSNALAVTQSRNLWSFASRNMEGSLLEAEILDLSETPKPLKDTITLSPQLDAPPPVESRPREKDVADIRSEIGVTPDPPKSNLDAIPLLVEVQNPDPMIPRSMAEASLRKRPTNRSAVKNATNSKADPCQMPNYQGFTDAQLNKEITAYGFKSIKQRVAMIQLLEKCWESKISMARQEVEANLNSKPPMDAAEVAVDKKSIPVKKRGRLPKSPTVPATKQNTGEVPSKKPRGRPKKDAAGSSTPKKLKQKVNKTDGERLDAATIAGDEIYDSSPPTPSPSRRRSSSKSPRQLKLTEPTKPLTSHGASEVRKDMAPLFEQITKAIQTFPPTHDPKHLTFNEKILMYEPIVLEDLATWLDAQGLSRLSEDDEVSPELVKEWCEERSVCCLWRENLRGGNRGRW